MKRLILFSIFALILTSCAPAQNVAALPLPDATVLISQPEVTATSIPLLIPTAEPLIPTAEPIKIACEPFIVDYCTTDGHFILRPIQPPNNDSVDTTYRYASTANGAREPHHGVEFLNKFGTPVQAAADGVVVFAGPDVEAVYSPWVNFYGNLVVIEHQGNVLPRTISGAGLSPLCQTTSTALEGAEIRPAPLLAAAERVQPPCKGDLCR